MAMGLAIFGHQLPDGVLKMDLFLVGRSVPFRARGSRSVPGRSVLPRSTWCRSWPKKMPPAFFASLEMQMSLVVGQCLRYFVRSTTTLREGK